MSATSKHSDERTSRRGGVARATLIALGVIAAAGIAAPASGQVSISIGAGYHDGYHHYDRPGYRTISGHHGTVVYDRGHSSGHSGVRTYSKPGFFSSHGIGTRNYRSNTYYRHTTVLPSTGYSVITPGYASRYQSRTPVYVNTIAPCPPPVVQQRVYVQPQVVERTVVVQRDDPYRYGRDDSNYGRDARSLIEDAERAHAAGDWHTAIRLYEQSISHRSNVAAARRGLAIVYLETDHVNDGLRLLERAYEEEPTLAVRVFDDRILVGARLGQLIEDAQRTAHRQSSARGWLALAVLRQSAGDRQGAREAIGEAARFGMNSRVVDSWYHATDR